MKTHTLKNISIALVVLISILGVSFTRAQSCSAVFTSSINGSTATFTNTSGIPTLYWWFGFGGTYGTMIYGSSQTTVTFPGNGTYPACLMVYDSLANCYDSTCTSITISGGTTSCQANFTYSLSGNTVYLTNTSTVSASSVSYWSFGDGGYSFQTSPTHTYSSSGNYWICLSVYDSLTSCYDSICKQVNIAGTGGPCVANFTYSINGNNVSFTNTSTGGTAMYWWFSFGGAGGTTSSQSNPTITFPGNGTYTACLSIMDTNGYWCDSICKPIVISGGSGGPCIANFTYSTNGNTVSFTNTSTGGTPMHWWFSNGSSYSSTSTQTNPTVTFPGSGTYTACLFLADTNGYWCDSTCKTIVIGTSTCSAGFNLYPDTSVAMGAYFFSTYPSPGLNYYWSFGDGTTSNSQYAQHSYTTPGTYIVCLYISRSNPFCSDSMCATVNVSQSGGVQMITTTINDKKEVATNINSYPNPFNGITNISYTLAKTSSVSISVFDMIGNQIAVLKNNSSEQAGAQNIQWDAAGFSSGIYLLNIKIDDKSYTQKLILSNN